MGSGASTQLTCPIGENEDDFNIILKLYDQIDTDGDQALEKQEVTAIANHHINNRILLLKQDISEINKKIEYYSCMTQKQKSELFIQKVSNSDHKIEFWKFYEYMKTRVGDIKNIGG
tara:strand:+ start:741 stop:1091 length:351 start_codon:yes stop_codon:yes gene_type:complete